MPGIFNKASRPLRPGAYFNWNAVAPQTIQPAVGSIVMVPFTSDWGPLKSFVLLDSFQEYLAVYGTTVGTPGYYAVWQAFNGEGGFEGRYGAGAVLGYRMGAASAAKATKILQNTTPAAAVTISAKYEGTFGNNISLTVQDHAGDTTQDDLLVIVQGQVVETYSYLDTDITGLVAQINLRSSWISAVQTITGVKLANITSTAMTGGNDGSATIASDWTVLQSALETQQFGVLAPYGLTDAPTIAALKTWAAGTSSGSTTGRNVKGQRFEVVLGGASDESSAAAVAAAALLADGNFIRLGMSHYIDSILLDANSLPVTLSPAQFSTRLAGVLAARGEAMSLTSARFPGITLVNGPTEADITATLNGGVMVLTQDSDPDAPVKVEAARTTFTAGAPGGAAAIPNFPYLIYRNPKFMRTMQNIEVEWTAWANRTLIGKLPVNNKTRDAGVAELARRLGAREDVGIVLPGWTVSVDQNPPPQDTDEYIALLVGIRFGRSVEQVYFTVQVS